MALNYDLYYINPQLCFLYCCAAFILQWSQFNNENIQTNRIAVETGSILLLYPRNILSIQNRDHLQLKEYKEQISHRNRPTKKTRVAILIYNKMESNQKESEDMGKDTSNSSNEKSTKKTLQFLYIPQTQKHPSS